MAFDFFDDEDGFDYQGNLMRPPSEADSILIQATVGCSHNKCSFCNAYKDKPLFKIKPEETILHDLAFAAKHCRRQTRLFLMDGDALIMPQKRLVWTLERIRDYLPWITRVGIYANGKGVRSKSDADLRQLADLGLKIAYLGLESGDDQTLKRIHKGSTADQLITAGRRLEDAGIANSVTVLLGIAGKERSLEHARATGKVLTAMNPSYVGALSVLVMPGTELAQELADGRFVPLDATELLTELREMILATNMNRGLFMANHASNYLPLKIIFPDGKADAIHAIDAALAGKIPLKPEWFRML